MSFLVCNTPIIPVYVKKEYLYDLEKGHGELTPGVWVTAKSVMGKALYFETLLTDYGALFDKLPFFLLLIKDPDDLSFVFAKSIISSHFSDEMAESKYQ